MKYISLCSGSKGNCSIIQHRNTTLMIDCGATQKYIKSKMEEIDVSLEQIDAVLVTHDHSDHIRGLNLCKQLPILGCTSVPGIKLLEPLKSYSIKELWITPLPLSHDSPNTCGYLIQSEQEKLVYMTDTGYVPKRLLPLIHNAEYYFIESNHDLTLLMNTNRPQYIKARIYSDRGHLCNEDCAAVLERVIGPSTKEITLAHLSEEANDPQLALSVVTEKLKDHPLCDRLILRAAGQFELCKGGEWDEETVDSTGSAAGVLECVFDV